MWDFNVIHEQSHMVNSFIQIELFSTKPHCYILLYELSHKPLWQDNKKNSKIDNDVLCL